ncbi:MAG: hypothetical protein ABTQ34_02505 [Bdellovibrionales bacterium]
MADKKGKPTKSSGSKAAQKPKGAGIYILPGILVGGSLFFVFPTFVLMAIGLIPTLVAIFTDTDREKYSATAVGAMNVAGLTPFVVELWTKGQTLGHVFEILKDANNWLVILGSAAIGQLLLFVVPQITASMTSAHYDIRLKTLKANLEELKNTWGPDVATTKPLERGDEH